MKTRAMSPGGRWRLVMAGVRTAIIAALVIGTGWGVWMIVEALQKDPGSLPAAAKAMPMKAPKLETTRDGVLDDAWLARTLELPPGVSLMELNLEKLQVRLLADRQVLTAGITRRFPDRLIVQITERMPIARVRIAERDGAHRDLLVAGDGIVFSGTGYDPAMLASLPWLDVALAREGTGIRAVVDMESVARLLSTAQFSAPHLYRSWQTISLARLASDRELEVTTKQGHTVVFSAKGEFFVQLARLDYLIEQLAREPNVCARIDLSFGREVPVTKELRPPAQAPLPVLKSVSPPLSTGPSTFQLRKTT